MTSNLSAHIGYLFKELPLLDRIAAARTCGFTAVEHPFPFEVSAKEWKRALDAEGMRFVQMSSGAGGAGRKGLACVAGSETAFAEDWDRALDFAEEIGCAMLHPMAGTHDGNVSTARQVYQGNIEYAVQSAKPRSVTVLIEAISERTVPGYFVSSLRCMEAELVSYRDQLSVLIDTYHAAVNQEDITNFLERSGFQLGHIHVADFPGRNEPGTGDVDFEALIEKLKTIGYRGHIGFECTPTRPPSQWLPNWISGSLSV